VISATTLEATGTASLTRFVLRRDRIRIVIWIAAIAALVVTTVASVKGLYPTAADLRQAAVASQGNAAAIAFNGPAQALDTLGGQVAFQVGAMGLVIVGLMNLLMIGRLTRGEEEAGRLELLRSLPVGPYAPPTAALLAVVGMDVILGAIVAVTLTAQGLPAAGSLAFGLSFTLFGVLFAALTLVAAQVSENTRVVYGMSGAVLGASFVLRAIGDIGNGAVSWLSPLGWAQKTRPFAGEQWWPFALIVAATAALVVLLVIVPGGGGRLNVVAKARAALAVQGRLVHLVAHEHVVAAHPTRGRLLGPRRFSFKWQQWATGNPPRWRIAYSFHGGYQLAFGHRAWSLYSQQRNTLTIEHGLRAKFAQTIPSSTSVLFGKAANGPIATIRSMLRRGELRDDGFASVDGQRVRCFVGERPASPGVAVPGRSRPQVVVRYYVDPDNYTPVAAQIGRPPGARSGRGHPHTLGGYSRIRFTSFERLPLTATSARLLRIHPSGHPRVTHFRANRGVVPVPPPAAH
jgi:hypothetical protein